MEKQGVVKPGLTPCDVCSKTSDVVIRDGRALCDEHDDRNVKKAGTQAPPLKSAAPSLADLHEAK